MLLTAVVARAQSELRAVHAHGQTFLVWKDTGGLAETETYEVYATTAAAPVTLGDFRRIGRVLPAEYRATRLKSAGEALRWRIPTGAGGETGAIAADEALFVYTPRTAQAEQFLVLRPGRTRLGEGARTGLVSQRMDPVTCHVQNTGIFDGYPYQDFAFWIDGADDESAGRPDFPVMGNGSFAGAPSLFRVYAPRSGLPSVRVPAVLFLHGNHGKWLNRKPGAEGFDTRLSQGLFVTLDDGVLVLQTEGGRVSVAQEFTRWLGYWNGFDRFAAVVGRLPPGDAVVIDYTIRRNAWIVQWLAANLPVDPHRVVLTGHSQGGSGGSLNVRARPELYSAALLFAGTVSTFKSNLTDEMQGSSSQNLRTNLRDVAGAILGVNDLYYPTTLASVFEPALMRFQWGVNDDVVEFVAASPGDPRSKPDAINALAARPIGAHSYWDGRNHEMEGWTPGEHHWAGARRQSAEYLTRYRNDQSYPAIWKDEHADNNPASACPTNPAVGPKTCTPAPGQVNWGTRGGYFEWDVETLRDETNGWEVTLYLVGESARVTEVPTFESATANVTLRRAQAFKPGPGTSLTWRFEREDGGLLQSGTSEVGVDGLVTIPALKVYRDPLRGRLKVRADVDPGGDPSSTRLGLRGWHAHGQTWLVWTEEKGLQRSDAYEIYASPTKPSTLSGMRLVGKVLADDWRATRLRRAGDELRWAIPDGRGGLVRLKPGEAVFAFTPHEAVSEYFAVVRRGTSELGTGNIAGPVAQGLDPVICHVQHSGVVNGHPFNDYALWVDGQPDPATSRPDIPVMANLNSGGVAHLFRVYQPRQQPSARVPALIFHHGGDGSWLGLQPDEVSNVSLTPPGGYLVTLDDNGVVAYPDRIETHQATKWFGYWEKFDRFDTNRVRPPAGSLVISYTLRRNAWIVDWVLRNESRIDPDRVLLGGHSMGGSGGNVNLRYRGDRYSAGLLFNGSTIVTTPGEMPFLLGDAEDNLPTDLRDPLGRPLGVNDCFHPWQPIGGAESPLQVLVWGVNDPTSKWIEERPAGGSKPDSMVSLSANRLGAVIYWDERDHGLEDSVGHWAGPNGRMNDGSQRITASFLARHRRNQSYPALSFDTHARSDPFAAVPFDPAADAAGRNWGTQGGYHNWDPDTIEDLPDRWSVSLWLTAASPYASDVPPFSSSVADVSLRRVQSFRPAPGETVTWRFRDAGPSAALLQSGTVAVGPDGLVTVPRLVVFKEPLVGRLEIERPLRAFQLTASGGAPGTVDLTISGGDSGAFVVEASTDLSVWREVSRRVYSGDALIIPVPVRQELRVEFLRARRLE